MEHNMSKTGTSPYDLAQAGHKLAIDPDGTLVHDYKDRLSLEERRELHTHFWNDMVLAEIEIIYRTIDPTYDTPIDDPARKVEDWLERDKKYRAKVIAAWEKRFATFRYIDGFFYAFRFGPGIILYDCFSFDRWRPDALAFQVQRWIEAVDASERSLKHARFLNIGLVAILLVTLIMLFGRA
jgi:hypothetical protein